VRDRRSSDTQPRRAPPAKSSPTAHVVDDGGRLASSVLALQRAGGNRATAQFLRQPAPARRLQRKVTGLREATPTSTFTKAAVDFWKDTANQGRSLEDYARHLIGKANEELKLLKSHEMKPAFAAISSPGNFDSMSWTVTMNTALFSRRSGVSKVGDLNLDEAAEAAAGVYHEARHAEQHFRIARTLAGESTKQSVPDIAAEIKAATLIPIDVALAAAAHPLKATTFNAGLLAEARDWRSATSGLHRGYKNVINVWDAEARSAQNVSYDLPALTGAKAGLETWMKSWRGSNRLKFIEGHIKAVKAVRPKSGVDTLALTNMRAIRAAMVKLEKAWTKVDSGWAQARPQEKLKRLQNFEQNALPAFEKALHAAYRAQPHETDAYEAEVAVGKQFRAAGKPAKP